jgi:hypothetical protein
LKEKRLKWQIDNLNLIDALPGNMSFEILYKIENDKEIHSIKGIPRK